MIERRVFWFSKGMKVLFKPERMYVNSNPETEGDKFRDLKFSDGLFLELPHIESALGPPFIVFLTPENIRDFVVTMVDLAEYLEANPNSNWPIHLRAMKLNYNDVMLRTWAQHDNVGVIQFSGGQFVENRTYWECSATKKDYLRFSEVLMQEVIRNDWLDRIISPDN